MIPVIDYPAVLQQMTERGFRCNYPNGGSFSFGPDARIHTRAWIGPPDPTIRPKFAQLVQMIQAPYEVNLAQALVRTWKETMPGRLWVMPMSHWHFELNFGSREWLPSLLEDIGVDSAALVHRSDASALEFTPEQPEPLERLIRGLLENLVSSDFMIVFCESPVLCALHHHKQLWWTTTEEGLLPRF
jgi:hypothetical protein